MNFIDESKLILEKESFSRKEIEKRMADGGFNSLAKFELFVWDLEMFLQLQKELGDKLILKGGAATQFYIPVTAQRTSIDIDMICLAKPDEVYLAISNIENELNGEGDYAKFIRYTPKNPKVGLSALETYHEVVPSVCDARELYATQGRQQVKIEFLYSDAKYEIQKIKQPELFALETEKEFNVLALNNLFADKLTTLGPNTIGISDKRSDEQLKQVYDVITLFISNIDLIIRDKEEVKTNYSKVAKMECEFRDMMYDPKLLLEDMILLINRIKNMENDTALLQKANDFQALYLRRMVNRDKAGWAIVGYQLELLVGYIFHDDTKILQFRKIEELIEKSGFNNICGPERGQLIRKVRNKLEVKFAHLKSLTSEIFRKRLDRIIWEIATFVTYEELDNSIREIIDME